MHPIITVRTWEHNALLQLHEMAEKSSKLLHDPAIWAIALVVALFVTACLLAMNTPTDMRPITIPQYTYPIYLP